MRRSPSAARRTGVSSRSTPVRLHHHKHERQKEIRRRRHRREKLKKWQAKLEKASGAERAAIAAKVRALTPGWQEVLQRWGLTDV